MESTVEKNTKFHILKKMPKTMKVYDDATSAFCFMMSMKDEDKDLIQDGHDISVIF